MSLKKEDTYKNQTPIVRVEIPEYIFDASTNPFAWDAENPQPTGDIIEAIEKALRDNFDMNHTLIRGVQSANHPMARDELIALIAENGSDAYKNTDQTALFAKEFDHQTLVEIINGFHIFKPKCEEIPQNPVDVWMIFDRDKFDNIEYLHPRHKVIARDKWQPKDSADRGLKGILVIN